MQPPKYRDIEMRIFNHQPARYSKGEIVASNVYDVTFRSVWPLRGQNKMPPPPPEEIAKCVANALAAFLPGTYEIEYWVSERKEQPASTAYGQVGEPVAKKMDDQDAFSMFELPGAPGKESAEVKKCRETAQDFGRRIGAAKTEAERKKIRKEFDEWAKTDPTFTTICKGVERLFNQ